MPERIETITKQQLQIAEQIHTEKREIATLYREYYGPVQSFIDAHEIAKDKLKLEFKAELVNDGFAERMHCKRNSDKLCRE